MSARVRMVGGATLLLLGAGSFALFGQVLWHVGLPQPQEAKALVYAWVLTLTIPLPISTGLALLWGVPSWRQFTGCWLLAAGVLALGSLFCFLPAYQGWPYSFVVGSAVCALPPLLAGLLLLLWGKYSSGTADSEM